MNFNFLRTNICFCTWFKFSELNFRFIEFMFCRNEITIYSVFLGLKSTSHCFAQLSKVWRSKFNRASIPNGLVDENIKELSSANNLTRLWISSAISFMKSNNSKDSETDPCGIPAFNVPGVEIELFYKWIDTH